MKGSGMAEVGIELGIEFSMPGSSSASIPIQWQLKDVVGAANQADAMGHTMLEVMVDVNKDSVTLRSVTPAGPGIHDPAIGALSETWDRSYDASIMSDGWKKSSSFRDSLRRSASRVKQFSQELARLPRNASRVQSVSLLSPDNDSVLSVPSDTQPTPSTSGGPAPRQNVSISRSVSGAEHALEGLRFISKATSTADRKSLWEAAEARFHKLASADHLLPRSHFAECIGMKDSKEFANELFDALVRRKGQKVQSISKEELYEYWLQITDKNFDSRMQIFFDLCDKDADGRISGEEVKEVIMLSASANKLSKLKEQAQEYAALIMEELDVDRMGYIELSQLESLMRGSVTVVGRESILQYSQGLIPQSQSSRSPKYLERSKYFFLDNWKRLWIIGLWLAVMAGLFIWKFIQYRHRNGFAIMGYCVCTAKGAAETLKLNMALILLPVCRNTITWLRSTRIGSFVPFDDNLNFHKVIAGAIAVGIVLHALLHISCDFPRISSAPYDKFDSAIGDDFGHIQPTYADIVNTPVGITGISMVILMSIAFLLATHWFRRNLVKLPWPFHRMTGFNAFWYSHHLFAIVYVLLMLHSFYLLLEQSWIQKTTWMYLGVPLLLYAGERTLRSLRAGHYKVDVVKAAIYPGNVLAIHMTKPEGFKYKSGMYLFLQCPELSPFEWHPFSITSAPGDPFLSVHIRTLGDWTEEMRRIFSEACGGRMRLQTVNNFGLSGELTLAARFPRLCIDGPYGAPAQDYLKYDVLLLVGLGIGATPFISILKDLLNHIKVGEPDATPDLRSPSESPRRKARKSRGTTNAYFYWVTREQGSFDWFRGVMREVEEMDNKAVIEMHNYLTSVYEEGDARSTLVMLLQALHHAKNGIDFVSGTRARTHFARPDWKNVFARLAATHQDKRIGVFYCGPSAVAKELESLSRTYSQTSTTKFEFHKENF